MRQGVVLPLRTQNNELKQMHENNEKLYCLEKIKRLLIQFAEGNVQKIFHIHINPYSLCTKKHSNTG